MMAAAATAQPGDHQIEEMVAGARAEDEGAPRRRAGLDAARALLRRHGQDAQGARGLRAPREDRAAGRHPSLADYADALALARGRNLAGEPTNFVMRALAGRPAPSQGAGACRHREAEQRRLRRLARLLGAAATPPWPPGSEEAERGAQHHRGRAQPRRRRREARAALQARSRPFRRAGAADPAGRRTRAAGAGRGARQGDAGRQDRLGHREARRTRSPARRAPRTPCSSTRAPRPARASRSPSCAAAPANCRRPSSSTTPWA
ncbi:MAG: hypothetical protein MZW92_36120 [Comamonadaceae bacterium]|nr:hypothetical protein [Comamonadaceae bacterium]